MGKQFTTEVFVPFCVLVSFNSFFLIGYAVLLYVLQPAFTRWIEAMLMLLVIDIFMQLIMLYLLKAKRELSNNWINVFHATTVFSSLYVAIPCAWAAFAFNSPLYVINKNIY